MLLLTDHVDGFWVNVVFDYKDKEMKSITRSDINLNNNEENISTKDSENNKSFEKLLNHIKEIFGSKIKEVKLSKKLTESPACITVPEGSMDIKMERFLMDQKQLAGPSPKIFEINPQHQVIINLANKATFDEDDNMLIKLLYNQACIIEGETITDIADFAKSINSVLKKAYLK